MEWETIILKELIYKPMTGEWGKELQGEEYENIVKVIRTANFTNIGVINYENIAYRNISPEKVEQKKLQLGDILVEKSGGTDKYPVGRVVLYDKKGEVFLSNNFTTVFRSKENIVYNKYLFYYLMFNYQLGGMTKYYNKTTGIQNLRVQNLINELRIPVPSIEIQKQIVDVLDEAQRFIDNRKEQIKLLDDLIESVFYDMFGDPVKNDKGFKKGTIRDITEYTQYGTSKKAYADGEFPIIRMGNLTYRGNWDFTSLKYIDLNEKEKKKYLVKRGDLLFNRTNSRELVGKTAVYKEEKIMAYAGYLIKLEPNELGNTEYISAYLNSKHGKLNLLNMAKSIVGMANINAQELQNIKILTPPIELQIQFAKKVEQIESQKQLLDNSLKLLEDNYNNLMQSAFKGELF